MKQVRDAVVAKILAAWTERVPDSDEVLGRYRVDLDAASVGGRKVYVFPLSTAGQLVTREEDQNDYALGLWVIERFTEAGDPSEEWLDARVEWVEWLWKLLGNARGPRLLVDPEVRDSGLWPQVAEITTVYDHDELVEGKLFASVLQVVYREHAEGEPT